MQKGSRVVLNSPYGEFTYMRGVIANGTRGRIMGEPSTGYPVLFDGYTQIVYVPIHWLAETREDE